MINHAIVRTTVSTHLFAVYRHKRRGVVVALAQRSMDRRFLATLMVGILAVAVAACGGSSSSSSDSPATSSSQSAVSAATSSGSYNYLKALSGGPIYTGSATVGYLIPSATITRWYSEDLPDFKAAMAKIAPHVKIVAFNANGDTATQLAQAKSAITEGAKVLLVSNTSSSQSGGLVSYASQNHVPVLVLERPLNDANTCCVVGDNPYEVGVAVGKWLEAHTKPGAVIAQINGDATDSFAVDEHNGVMSVLGPLFKSGARKMVGNLWTPGYLPANAQTEMNAILTRTHDKINAVDNFNDDMAQAVEAALQTVGLAGKIPVTGMDGTLPGMQSIVRGRQTVSAFRPYTYQADHAALATAYLLAGKSFPPGLFNENVNNGLKTVPFSAAPIYMVTKNNIASLVKSGILPYTMTQICQGIPQGAAPC
jgi:D-xylose transport system substrate-binding protein